MAEAARAVEDVEERKTREDGHGKRPSQVKKREAPQRATVRRHKTFGDVAGENFQTLSLEGGFRSSDEVTPPHRYIAEFNGIIQ